MRTSSNDGVVLGREAPKDFADLTGGLPRMPRRRLGGIVIAAVSCCALILVAAGLTRVSHASASAHVAPAPADPPALAAAANESASAAGNAAQSAKVEPTPEPAPTTGTLRLERPSWLARVSVDGKKLTSASETLSCGKHTVKVTGFRAHPIDVPCGGELVLLH